MVNEFTNNPFEKTTQTLNHIRYVVKYFSDKIQPHYKILDIGQRSPLTNALERKFKVKIDNTSGDLDTRFTIQSKYYNIVIYSHTIEHQFNPLNTLLRIREVMNETTLLYIFTPDRGKLLWCKGHYHEIDSYRMRLLLQRAGYEILSKKKYKIWRHWTSYLKGFRPLLRLFREYTVIYKVRATVHRTKYSAAVLCRPPQYSVSQKRECNYENSKITGLIVLGILIGSLIVFYGIIGILADVLGFTILSIVRGL